MIMKLDKFLIEELNNHGYDIDFKTLKAIYVKSRENPSCKARKARNLKTEEIMNRMDDLLQE